MADPRTVDDPATQTRNEVLLVGRVSGEVEERTMPSGDVAVTWRVVVPRPPGRSEGERRRSSVDTLECVAYAAAPRRSALTWVEGDVVEVTGSLRRRFWRSPGGAASRTVIEVARGRRVARAATRRAAAAAGPSAASA